MKIISRIDDKKISSTNIFIEIEYKEYLSFSKKIIHNNDLQRKRVKSSKTVYSLLKDDLKDGCIIPPIVLAISDAGYSKEWSNEDVEKFINRNIEKLLILDGLQRTYTLIDAEKELKQEKDIEKIADFEKRILRLELYVGINKFGILYRMLTLNTGQTPMSLRHQIEILYKNFADEPIEGVQIITETDNARLGDVGVYNFKDVIEGFNSYLERNELPLEKVDVLQNIKSLEKLSIENNKKDLFKDFIEIYNKLVIKLDNESNNMQVNSEVIIYEKIDSTPFGKDVVKIFNKSQALTGFGAAIGKLKDFKLINDIYEIEKSIDCIKGNGEQWVYSLLKNLDKIKNEAKKIGNSQRMYFQYFFRELLNKESDSYLKLEDAVENSYIKYRSQVY
ncbi:hypothetical protein [Clostridium perfringens]|uniref:hypothetical protein n=1 Tax=Clostridium perfringens TaxID=1502 RepID=UPI0030D213A0